MSETRKPRVGVYVCHCGGNISDFVDVKKVAESIKAEDADVVVSKDLMFDCSDASQNEMIEDVKARNLDRIVVASCSPKLHEMTFRGTTKRAGLNPYMFYHANIREQASWAHGDDKPGATAKAQAHVRAAVAYVKLADPLDKIKTESTQTVLIIGGGVAGMRAALDLADMNVCVVLVERSHSLGGHVSELSEIYPYGMHGAQVVRALALQLAGRENVAVFTNATVESFKGYVGKFEVKIRISPRYVVSDSEKLNEAIRACPVSVPDESEHGLVSRKAIYRPLGYSMSNLPTIDMRSCTKCGICVDVCGNNVIDLEQKEQEINVQVGSIIVATGFDSYSPKVSEFGYGTVNGVVTLPELERLMELSVGKTLEYKGKSVKDIAYIYCVGSRQKDSGENPKPNKYCSRFCCNAAINSALVLKEKFADLKIYHLYRDMRTYGRNEQMYEEAGREGSTFVRFDDENEPRVTERGGKCMVTVRSSLVDNTQIEFAVDLVVLVTGMVPTSNASLNEMLSLPIGLDGFYREVHLKLRPVETNIAGLLIAGTAQSPKDVRETLASASAAAAKAAAFALKKELELEPFVARVDPTTCEGTQACIAECPYGAIELENLERKSTANVNIAKCKGCGACVAVCPTEAIQLQGLTNSEIRVMIGALAR
ncbi:MAG: CoB--CoM heterodisulfide reductase iron-sulfur subunit A family protein [Nitrososphaerota archaeon]|nr:CoB--CoM heterodisulfide reductase iron-sulfur subunit A family protein [Nitrososphaerota archaeon]MDG6922096.1 CoB--CoM heterodisulfide reductase iron-sulfur subunit A family protein [Nitrososphaerota archaeon]